MTTLPFILNPVADQNGARESSSDERAWLPLPSFNGASEPTPKTTPKATPTPTSDDRQDNASKPQNLDFKPQAAGSGSIPATSVSQPVPALGLPNEKGNRPDEPEWVTHSGVEGRPYLTEEIYESKDRTELLGEDRCSYCKHWNRSCVTVLKFPEEPSLGDLDVCGYCAKDGKKTCGAGKNAWKAEYRKMIENDAANPISRRVNRRISKPPTNTLLSPSSSSAAATDTKKAAASKTGPRGIRRTHSSDSLESQGSAPKRQKIVFRKQINSTPLAPAKRASAVSDEKDAAYDGRKDPEKVKARVAKMKITLAAKKAAKEAEDRKNASKTSAPAISTPKTTEKAKASKASARPNGTQTEPKPAITSKTMADPNRRPGITNAPASASAHKARNTLQSDADVLHAAFKAMPTGKAKKPSNASRTAAARSAALLAKNSRKRAARISNESAASVEMGVNALLGSVEPQGLHMHDEDDDDEDEDDDEYAAGRGVDGGDDDLSSDARSLGDVEAEHERLKMQLARLEAREKKAQMLEDNENMRRRIEELRRKSLSRRDSSGVPSSAA